MMPTEEQSTERLTELINGEAATRTREAVTGYQYMAYSETREKQILEFIKPTGGHALITIQREPDGAISKTTPWDSDNPTLYDRTMKGMIQDHETENNLLTTLKAMIMKEALSAAGRVNPETLRKYSFGNSLESQAKDILKEIRGRSKTPNWLREQSQDQKGNQDILYKFMTPADIQIFIEHLCGRETPVTVRRYNTIARNIRVFKEMEAPGENNVLHHYFNMFGDKPDQPAINHPGQITALMREKLRLNDSQWHTFAQTPHQAWSNRRSTSFTIEEISKVSTVLHAANARASDEESLGEIIQLIARPDTDLDHPWSHGRPLDAWANLARRYLELPIYRHMMRTSPEVQTMSNVADSLRESIRADQPWGQATWDILVQRSDRWHREQQEHANREREKARVAEMNQRWESAIQETTIGPYTFTALSTPLELDQTGEEMENCIGSYHLSCIGGTNRIFRVKQDEELVAAAELFLANNTWEIGQAESHKRGKPPQEFHQHHLELCRLYNQAFRSQPQPEFNP